MCERLKKEKMIRLFCLFILFDTVLFAQDASPWSIGVLGSGATTYRFTSSDASMSWLKDELDSTESWTNSYSYGVSADYGFSEKLSLRSGFIFNQSGQGINCSRSTTNSSILL